MCGLTIFFVILYLAVSWISVVSAAGDGRSDRIVSLSSEGCPTGKWRCENGLCVAATAVCDGEFQCEDGSDEALILCRGTTRPLFGLMLHCSQTWSSNYDTVCPEACRRWPQYCYYVLAGDHGVPGVCTFPEFPRVGTYDIDDIVLRPGGVSADFSLVYSCPLNYTLEGSSPRCVKGTWVGNTPTCQIYCKLPRHPSVTYWCKLTDPSTLRSERQCDEYEPNGSVVLPKCNDNIINHRDLSHMHCIDGSWDYVAICAPECGTVMPQGEQLKRDVSAKHGELPWHTLIYDKRFAPFMQICGGSLASTTVVISAAHCFWNDWEGVLPAKNFAVGVGKIYRSWNIEDGGQKSNVTDIKVPPRFSGAGSNFQDDIALIILMTPVVLTNYVRPVCIDFGVLFDKRQLQPGNIGKVASWGLTSEDGDASQVLKVTELPYVDVEQCIADFPFDFRLYITSDKICAGSKTGPALCKGDSGGGLVFPEVDRGVQRWYLRGVVSTAPSNGHKCNSNVYSSFTQLLKHDDFVRKHLNNRR